MEKKARGYSKAGVFTLAKGATCKSCMYNVFCSVKLKAKKCCNHSEYNTPPCPSLPEGETRTNVHQPPRPLLLEGSQSGRPSRSGEVALALPRGFEGCLWFGTEVLTCTIEMILVSTVLVSSCMGMAYVLPLVE